MTWTELQFADGVNKVKVERQNNEHSSCVKGQKMKNAKQR